MHGRASVGDVLIALVGAATFAVAQWWSFSVQPRTSSTPFADPTGWFLNSGLSVAIISGAIAASSAVAALVRHGAPLRVAAAVAVGAGFAMVVVLVGWGAGHLFPIVILFGGAVLLLAAIGGAQLADGCRRVLSRDAPAKTRGH